MTELPMPDMKTINGHTYVKVKDLADAWHTTTSSILCTGKPQQVPVKYRRTIDGRTWCDVEGLKARLNMMKRGGKIPGQLRQFLDCLPVLDFEKTGPLTETVHEVNGGTTTIYRSTFQNIDEPSPEEMRDALENRQVIYRYKNDGIQVLAQTLSNYLDTRTSSLLAVNKKQGVPRKFIHRQWKRTWVDLEGLKQRVQHTEHGSALLKGLNWVVQYLDGGGKPFDELVEIMKQSKSAKSKQKKQRSKPQEPASARKKQAKKQAKPGTKRNPIDICKVAVEANKRAVHNTERLNKLTRDEAALENIWFSTRGAVSTDLATQSKRLDMFADRIHDLDVRAKALEHDVPQLLHAGCSVKERVDRLGKQATQNTVNQTLLGDLNTRLGRVVSQADSLDTRTDGLGSRVSVLEDTSKWLGWTLAGVIGLRFLGLMLRWLRRK